MQQTEKYKLNLIEPSDPFLPEGLNENTQKIEDVLVERMEGPLGAMQNQVDAIAKNLGAGGKNCRIAWGSYTGTGQHGADHPNRLDLGFYPVFLLVARDNSFYSLEGPTMALRGIGASHATNSTNTLAIIWRDDGVDWYATTTDSAQNNAGTRYYYFVIGVDPNS